MEENRNDQLRKGKIDSSIFTGKQSQLRLEPKITQDLLKEKNHREFLTSSVLIDRAIYRFVVVTFISLSFNLSLSCFPFFSLTLHKLLLRFSINKHQRAVMVHQVPPAVMELKNIRHVK